MADLLVRPDLPPRWPAVVRAELERRHAQVARHLGAVAPVLDVGTPAGRAVLAEVIDGAEPPAPCAAVVSVAGLVRFADLPAAVAALDRLLAPDGELHLVEPVGRPGLPGLLASSAGALLPPARGAHLARDVPAALRGAGWSVTDCLRFSMPTTVWPLRPFVQLRAVRIAPHAPGGGW